MFLKMCKILLTSITKHFWDRSYNAKIYKCL